MDSIIAALREEEKEARKLVLRYTKTLEKLPKGSFFIRNLGKKGRYGYLTYSESGKISQKYLGKLTDAKEKHYEELMVRKKKLKSLRKMAERQKSFLEKALRHARK